MEKSESRASQPEASAPRGGRRTPASRPKEESTPNLNPELFVVQTHEAAVLGQDGDARREAGADSNDGEETYPEGGSRAWLVVLGSWLALFSSLGLMNSIATFQTYISTHQLSNYDEGTIGWVFSVYTFLAFFLGVYIGPIFDKYGPRWLVFVGAACLFLTFMLLSISTEYWHFLLVFGMLGGLATALLFTPSIAAVGHFFRDRRGFATGIACTGGGLGGIVYPLALQRLFDKVGWAWAIRILGFACLFLTTAAIFLIKKRLPAPRNSSIHPDFRIFANTAFLLTTIGIFLLEFGLFVPLAFISSYALAHGFPEPFSFQILTVFNAGSVVGRLLPGWYADKIGVFNANIIAVAISIVACLGVWWPAGPSTAGLVVFSVTFGFASGSNISLTPVCIGRLCRTQHYGRYYATCYTVASVACLVGIPIAGNILASNGGDYWGLILFTGMVYLGSLIALCAAKISCVSWRPWTIF